MFTQEKVDEILQVTILEEVIGEFEELKKNGISSYCTCPVCGKTGKSKGLSVSPVKKIFKCFSCDFSGNNAITYLCEAKKMSYPEALQFLATKYNIVVEEIKKGPQKKEKSLKNSFRNLQLSLSGLTDEDQKIFVPVPEDDPEYTNKNTQKQINILKWHT